MSNDDEETKTEDTTAEQAEDTKDTEDTDAKAEETTADDAAGAETTDTEVAERTPGAVGRAAGGLRRHWVATLLTVLLLASAGAAGGEITNAIRSRLLDIQYGRVEDTHGWLTQLA